MATLPIFDNTGNNEEDEVDMAYQINPSTAAPIDFPPMQVWGDGEHTWK